MRYIPPNAVTASRLLLTLFSLIAVYERDIEAAALWIVAAIVVDMFDGYLAIALDAKSAFGMEFDTQVDAIAFGLGPAFLVYGWRFHSDDAAGLLLSFLPLVCATIRGSFYMIQEQNSTTFRGLVMPASATVLSGMVFWDLSLFWSACVVVLVCVLMVSRFEYLRIKGMMMVVVTALFIGASLFFQEGLFIMGLLYALHGPVYHYFFRP